MTIMKKSACNVTVLSCQVRTFARKHAARNTGESFKSTALEHQASRS